MTTAELNLERLRSHIGHRLVSTDVAAPGPANLLRLAFGRPEPEPAGGRSSAPRRWHGLYFLPRFRPRKSCGQTGARRRGGGAGDAPCPGACSRGRVCAFTGPSTSARSCGGETELADLSVKTGATGTLVFATATQPHPHAGRPRPRGGAPDRLPRRGPGGRAQPGPPPRGGARRHAVATARPRSGTAVPLLRPHLQQPPDPLRPPLGHRGRGVPRARGPRAAHNDLADRLRPRPQRRSGPFSATRRRPGRPLFDTAPFELRGRPAADGGAPSCGRSRRRARWP